MPETSRVYYLWVARDKSGKLQLFGARPFKWKWLGEWGGDCLGNLNPEDFPDVTWKNSPQQVEMLLRKHNDVQELKM